MNRNFQDAQNWVAPRDPLVLDLDNDGIEAVGINPAAPILFDMDGDGIKTATGWIKADDGMVVLDRNGNGLIDSGRELFGDSTILTRGPRAGQTAANGYEALADLDINGDGVINSLDAAYASLRIWQDANQDGISQASELRTLSSLGIASLNVTGQASNVNLGNGNTQPFSGSFTRTNGSTGASGVAEVSGSLLLAGNNFYREFTDNPATTAAAAALPQMRGSGWVRDLREAVSLGTAAAGTLQGDLSAFAAAGTRGAQLGVMDSMLMRWADTTGRFLPGSHMYSLRPDQTGALTTSSYQFTRGGLALVVHPAGMEITEYFGSAGPRTRPTAEGYQVLHRLSVLEVFNGSKFFVGPLLEQATPIAAGQGGGSGGGGGIAGENELHLTLSAVQISFINQAYEALVESVYSALVLQTRLKPYLDSIGLVIDGAGVRFDTAALDALLAAGRASNEANAFADLVDLNRFAQSTLLSVGFDGLGRLKGWIDALPPGSPVFATFTALNLYVASATAGSAQSDTWFGNSGANVFSGGAGNDTLSGEAGNDTLLGDDGADTLLGGLGNDLLQGGNDNDNLQGGDGVDALYGGAGNDMLEGGLGNDNLYGDAGGDVYLFNRGGGQDTINNYDSDALGTNADTLRFSADILPSDVRATRVGNNLLLSIVGSTDSVTVTAYFSADGTSAHALENIAFANGVVWNVAAVMASVLVATAGNDIIQGYATADTLSGGAGDDSIIGYAGNDTLSGEVGNDTLLGDDGADTLLGGLGNDLLQGGNDNDNLQGGDGVDALYGGVGNDTLEGGAGNDNLYGDAGADVYLFNRGGGQDTINNYDSDALGTNADTLRFGVDILPADVLATRSGSNLVLSVVGSTDSVTVTGYFSADATTAHALENIAFANGVVWNIATVMANVLVGTAGNDIIQGYATADTLSGGAGDDSILGGAGADTINGDAGNDNLQGEDGADTLAGGAGNDYLSGGNDNDNLQGGDGDDRLLGGAGNDTLEGGAGNDNLGGDAGADVYLFNRGGGQDSINNYDSDALGTNADTLRFGAGILPSDVRATRVGGNLLLSIVGSTDSVTVAAYFTTDATTPYVIENIAFANGVVWNVATVMAQVLLGTAGNDVIQGYATADTLSGGAGDDTILGGAGADTINGDAGNDNLQGEDGADTLAGGAGNDYLAGGEGNDNLAGGDGDDRLLGGAGNDTLEGGAGNDNLGGDAGADVYLFNRGGGQDTISDSDATVGVVDVARFATGIAADQLWFVKSGNNLDVSIIGTTDKFTVTNWYLGNQYHLEQFKTSDGKTLLDSQVQNLVSAMAAFAPPAAGQLTLTAAYATSLAPVIAANWQ